MEAYFTTGYFHCDTYKKQPITDQNLSSMVPHPYQNTNLSSVHYVNVPQHVPVLSLDILQSVEVSKETCVFNVSFDR